MPFNQKDSPGTLTEGVFCSLHRYNFFFVGFLRFDFHWGVVQKFCALIRSGVSLRGFARFLISRLRQIILTVFHTRTGTTQRYKILPRFIYESTFHATTCERTHKLIQDQSHLAEGLKVREIRERFVRIGMQGYGTRGRIDAHVATLHFIWLVDHPTYFDSF